LRRAYDYWQNQPGCFLSVRQTPLALPSLQIAAPERDLWWLTLDCRLQHSCGRRLQQRSQPHITDRALHQMPSKALSIHPGTSSKEEAIIHRGIPFNGGAEKCKISSRPGTLHAVRSFRRAPWSLAVTPQAEASKTKHTLLVCNKLSLPTMPSGRPSPSKSAYRFRLLHNVQQQTNILAGQVSGRWHREPSSLRHNQPDHPIAACSWNTSSSLIAASSYTCQRQSHQQPQKGYMWPGSPLAAAG